MTMGKTEIPGMYKEKDGVVLNRDLSSLQAYKIRKEKERKLNVVQEEIESLKTDIQEIKTMLRAILK